MSSAVSLLGVPLPLLLNPGRHQHRQERRATQPQQIRTHGASSSAGGESSGRSGVPLPLSFARQAELRGGGGERLGEVVASTRSREGGNEEEAIGVVAQRQALLSHLISDIEQRQQWGRGKGRGRGFKVYKGNQLLDDAVLDWKESDLGTRLVAEAEAEQQIEAGLGGSDIPSETDEADALARLVSGDLDFESKWAQGTENRASQHHALSASYEALVAMARRDVGYAQADLDAAQAALDTEQETADGLQTILDDKTAATAQATTAHESAVAAEAAATSNVASSEAGVEAATSDVATAQADVDAKQSEYDAAQQTADTALTDLTDASSTETDVVGLTTSLSTLQGIADGVKSELTALESSLTQAQSSLTAANEALATAQAAESAAREATASAEAAQAAAQAEQDTAQANYDAQMEIVVEKTALRDERQGVYNQLKAVLDAHNAKKSAAETAAIQAALTAYNRANTPAASA